MSAAVFCGVVQRCRRLNGEHDERENLRASGRNKLPSTVRVGVIKAGINVPSLDRT